MNDQCYLLSGKLQDKPPMSAVLSKTSPIYLEFAVEEIPGEDVEMLKRLNHKASENICILPSYL